MEILKLIGYHGTLKSNADRIYKEGFLPSKKGWLGQGVYYFEDLNTISGFEEAEKWSKKRQHMLKDWVVLKSIISVNVEKFLDIAYNKKDQEYFLKLRDVFVKNLKKEGRNVEYDKIDYGVYGYIDKKNFFEVIRVVIDPRKLEDKKKDLYKYNYTIIIRQIQICVKNLDRIETIELIG